jgi:DNA-binding transcriptional regulator YiaG
MVALLEEVRLAVSLPDPTTRMAIRRRARVSRERMAAELGVQPLAVARWERATRNPRGGLRVRYARLLEMLDEIAATAGERSAGAQEP